VRRVATRATNQGIHGRDLCAQWRTLRSGMELHPLRDEVAHGVVTGGRLR
jgi:hypothetical protein